MSRDFNVSLCSSDSGLGSSFSLGKRGGSRSTDVGSFSGRNRVFTVAPTTIEEDLRRTKILSSFMELRQEVKRSRSLNFFPLCWTSKETSLVLFDLSSGGH